MLITLSGDEFLLTRVLTRTPITNGVPSAEGTKLCFYGLSYLISCSDYTSLTSHLAKLSLGIKILLLDAARLVPDDPAGVGFD